MTPRVAFGATPLKGGRTLWSGEASSTGALDHEPALRCYH